MLNYKLQTIQNNHIYLKYFLIQIVFLLQSLKKWWVNQQEYRILTKYSTFLNVRKVPKEAFAVE